MLPATFFDYQKLLSTYYKPIPSGSVKQNHYFWVEDKNATTMYRLTHWNDENATTESMKHIINLPDRLRKLKEDFTCNMSMLTASGMKPIKQVELWKKWGLLIPEDERHHLCSQPSDDIIRKVANEKVDKQRNKNNMKRSTDDRHNNNNNRLADEQQMNVNNNNKRSADEQ
jgi:hypothetical protein